MTTGSGSGQAALRSRNPFLSPGHSQSDSRLSTWNTWNTNQYSSSNVGTTFNLTYSDVRTRGTKSFLYLFGFVSLIHSGAPASVDLGLFVSYGTGGGTGIYVGNYDGTLVPSATLYTPYHLSGMLDLSQLYSGGYFRPGQHSIGLDIKNNTAGTVTSQPTSGFSTFLNVNSLEVPFVGGSI